MTPDQFIYPISCEYQLEDYRLSLVYEPALVKEVLPTQQLRQLLSFFEQGEEAIFPATDLHEIYLNILPFSKSFLQYEIYHDMLVYKHHEIIWSSRCDRIEKSTLIELGCRKKAFTRDLYLH